MTSIVIMNMHYTGLGIARDLSSIATQIYGLSYNDSFFGNSSNCCTPLLFPDTEKAPEDALTFLKKLAEEIGEKAILLPTRDHDINLIIRYRSEFEKLFLIPFPSNQIWLNVIDKNELYHSAKRINIAFPVTHLVNDPRDLSRYEDEFVFPSLIKPVLSSDWRHPKIWDMVGQRKAIFVSSMNQLKEEYAKIAELSPRVHIQQYIDGSEQDIVVFGSYRAKRNGVFDYFTARKIIQYPPGSGTGVIVASEKIPEIVEQSKKLLSVLNYNGVSEIEYKYDRNSQQYYLIEINGRHWDQHSLGTACGVNLSLSMYNDVTGASPKTQTQNTKRRHWIADDTFWLSLATDLIRRNNSLKHYLKALLSPKVWAVLRWRDLGPYPKVIRNLVAVLYDLIRAKFR